MHLKKSKRRCDRNERSKGSRLTDIVNVYGRLLVKLLITKVDCKVLILFDFSTSVTGSTIRQRQENSYTDGRSYKIKRRDANPDTRSNTIKRTDEKP